MSVLGFRVSAAVRTVNAPTAVPTLPSGPAAVRLVPVESLTDEQAEAYGKSAEEPTRP
jgi:hypothetical protein